LEDVKKGVLAWVVKVEMFFGVSKLLPPYVSHPLETEEFWT